MASLFVKCAACNGEGIHKTSFLPKCNVCGGSGRLNVQEEIRKDDGVETCASCHHGNCRIHL